jgi:hypothetical protein
MAYRKSASGSGSRSGYGWLRVGEGSRSPFVIQEDTVHRVRFVVVGDGKYLVRCSRKGCRFRVEGVQGLEEANRIATAHRESTSQK